MERTSVPLISEGGWRLTARVHRPASSSGRLPAVLLIPGIDAPAAAFESWGSPLHADDIVHLGALAMALDLSGRGTSWGNEDYGGPDHQGDIRAALMHIAARSDVDPARLGIVSLSLGGVAVAGALAHGSTPPIQWWIDWEAPSDREIITAGGTRMDPAAGHHLTDEAYWRPREPTRWVGQTGVPYLRYQSVRDHAQPGELRHAQRMMAAAAAGDLPWFQLNDHPRGALPQSPRWLPAGPAAANAWIVRHIRDLHSL